MSLPYSPVSPKNTMSSGQGHQLPSLSKQFPEVFPSQKPQSPPKTPTPSSASGRVSPPKRRWSERAEGDDGDEPVEPARKRISVYSNSGAASAPPRPDALGPSVSSLRSPRSAPRNPIQLPPLQTYLHDPRENQSHGSPAGLRQDTRPENFQTSQAPALDSTSMSHSSLLLEHSRNPAGPIPGRFAEAREVGREHSAPVRSRQAVAPFVAGVELMPSPQDPAVSRSAPSTFPPPLPRRDEYGRSYSVTSQTQHSYFPPVPGPSESRRYSLDQIPGVAGHINTPPSNATSRYIWEMPSAGVGSSAMPVTNVANPNGRKRRGNLPKESTQVLNDWFVKHASFPYPKESEKQQLQGATGLTLSQISNWFINARRRRRPETSNPPPPSAQTQDTRDYPPAGRAPVSQPPPHGYPPQDHWDRMP